MATASNTTYRLHNDHQLKGILWGITLGVYGVLLVFAWMTSEILIAEYNQHNLNVGGLFIIIIFAHLFYSLRRVQANDRAALYFYGRYVADVHPGLNLIPAGGLSNIQTFPRDLQTIQEPGARDSIFWGDEKIDLPKGMVRPIFMNTRSATTDEIGELDVQMTVGISYTILWVVERVAPFLSTLHTLEEAEEQIRQLSERILGEIIAERTADGAITKQKEVNIELKERLTAEVSEWGVGINVAGLTGINLSHSLNQAMRDRAESQFRADAVVIAATADSTSIELRGAADGKAAYARAFGDMSGRAEGMALIVTKLEVPGSSVLAAETARATIPGAKATILGEAGLMQAASIGAIIENALTGSGELK